jgi:hypothetical protein
MLHALPCGCCYKLLPALEALVYTVAGIGISSSTYHSTSCTSTELLGHPDSGTLANIIPVLPTSYPSVVAGMGLFLEGAALPGSLLALFPGLVYHKPVYRCATSSGAVPRQ